MDLTTRRNFDASNSVNFSTWPFSIRYCTGGFPVGLDSEFLGTRSFGLVSTIPQNGNACIVSLPRLHSIYACAQGQILSVVSSRTHASCASKRPSNSVGVFCQRPCSDGAVSVCHSLTSMPWVSAKAFKRDPCSSAQRYGAANANGARTPNREAVWKRMLT